MDKFDKGKYVFSNAPSIVDVSEECVKKREKQISLMIKELFLYKVILKDLIAHKPSEEDKNLILNIAYYIINNIELLELFQSKRELPYIKIIRLTGTTKSYLEKWQDYIITYIVLLANPNYKYVQDYFRIEYKENYKEILYVENKKHNEFKGIALKVNKRSSIILTSKGDFIKVKSKDSIYVGKEVYAEEKIGFRHIRLKIGILILLLLAIAIGVYSDYKTSVRTILIESTSEIKIQTNRYDKVIYTYAETEKGKNMLSYIDSLDQDLDSVLKNCINYADNNEMIPEKGLLITVTGEPIEYGSLEETGNYIVDKEISIKINNSGNEHKLYDVIVKKRKEKSSED